MWFAFTDEQEDLRALVRSFLATHGVTSREPGSLDTALWRRLATELGLTGLAADPSLGGPVELAVVLEETGRALLALPYLSTAVSAQVLPEQFLDGIATLADLGTGPGLPGIPLAIAAPGLRVTLVEANGKKARFLREAVRTLGLANAEVAQARIEALDQPGAFDAITARALATLPQILELGGRLVGPGGKLLALKGTRPGEEIAALPPGWRLEALHRLRVPGLEGERHLAVVGREPTRTA